jgi:ubiquinone/menaquinone biosynthesis C-methylase UbiE
MSDYPWQHTLKGEPERLRMMSDLLDPSSEFHLQRIGVAAGWRTFEIGAGNGSLSQWLAKRVGPNGCAIATDIRTDLMANLTGDNLETRRFDVQSDEPPDAPFDLVAVRALLHHLPQWREVVSKMARWVKPGGWLFIHEPDFYPTWTVEPASQKSFWQQFVQWAATHGTDYYVGHKIAPWLQAEGLENINAEAHAVVYNGGSEFAQWWMNGIAEVAEQLQSEGGVTKAILDEFFTDYRDPKYWTTTIAFTVVTAQRPK